MLAKHKIAYTSFTPVWSVEKAGSKKNVLCLLKNNFLHPRMDVDKR